MTEKKGEEKVLQEKGREGRLLRLNPYPLLYIHMRVKDKERV